MSDDQKIWFIYLTDHHEGPFTVAEIGEKAKAALVNGQSLAWKDGMPEWVPAETIPELRAAVTSTGASASPVKAPAPLVTETADGEVSLAQLLANAQKGDEPAEISDSATVLSSMVASVHSSAAESSVPEARNTMELSVPLNVVSDAASSVRDPAPDEEAWTLHLGGKVSGLYSLRKLKELASAGEIPLEAKIWHAGWSDFQPLSAVPDLASAAKSRSVRAGGATRTQVTRPSVSASVSAKLVGDEDEEPTDTGIKAPSAGGLRGLIAKVRGLTAKKAKAKPAPEVTKQTKLTGKTTIVKKPVGKGRAAGIGRIGGLLAVVLLVLGAGGGAYYFIFMSPIPSSLDVSEEDREAMIEVVKGKGSHKLYLAAAKGTEENPADPNAPKYYVATALPEGTAMTLSVSGVPGTLVNRLAFDKTFNANVDKDHLAVFDKVSDDGKPLWGDFTIKVTADGTDPLDAGKRFIGIKGAPYGKRLAAYKLSVQGDYDKEIAELREFITTLKNLQTEASKQIADYKTNGSVPASKSKINGAWGEFTRNSQGLLTQLESNLKARQSGDKTPKYHARAFQDVSTTAGQLDQLMKAHSERLSGAAPSANADELDGLVQAGVQALDAWLAQAVAKTPFDAHSSPDAAKPASTKPSATTPPAAAPAPVAAAAAAAPAAAAATATKPAVAAAPAAVPPSAAPAAPAPAAPAPAATGAAKP